MSNLDKKNSLIIGTRQSELALVQTYQVVELLKKFNKELNIEVKRISTIGDKILDKPLQAIGEKSLFTKELEVCLLNGEVDIVVHSLKDVTTVLPDGTCLGAILKRENPCDVLVLANGKSGNLENLPEGSCIGTGSVRRVGQLKRLYPHLKFEGIRGNLNTRLSKLDDPNSPYDGIILAYAGLLRLNKVDRISAHLNNIYHAVGQAAIGIQCKVNDLKVLKLLKDLNHCNTLIMCTAERSFMRELEGGCSVPLGVNTSIVDKTLSLSGLVCSVDGQNLVKHESHIEIDLNNLEESLEKAKELGIDLSLKLIKLGVRDILDKVRD
ncbi:hypothetical protein HK099_005384 [Clydaea vesicula]|uniref:hydroxymethylbilane synthase n=1 Tax=Clydaea vesicula TaxID=447962 RepID=A0AAD5TZ88_9FUNG|nr:hypothetical protein HK099_005384 [Clydaea vesicula]KAJ3380577.1 hypothetical protein HDU92_005891 [Lobulomyces angularis]